MYSQKGREEESFNLREVTVLKKCTIQNSLIPKSLKQYDEYIISKFINFKPSEKKNTSGQEYSIRWDANILRMFNCHSS